MSGIYYPNAEDIQALLAKLNISDAPYVLGVRQQNKAKSILGWLSATVLYFAPSADTRVLVATPTKLYVINPNGHMAGSFAQLPKHYIEEIDWADCQPVQVEKTAEAYLVSLVRKGKRITWQLPLSDQRMPYNTTNADAFVQQCQAS